MESQMSSMHRANSSTESALQVSTAAFSLMRSPAPTQAVSVPIFQTPHSPLEANPSDQGSDVRATDWTVVELCIGVLSACLPTMRPLFSRTRGKAGSGAEQGQEKSDSRGRSDQSLTLQESRSIPSQSKHFAHLGVLGDVEHAQDVTPAQDVPPTHW